MSWVAVGTTAVGVVGAYAKQDAAKGSAGGSGFMGGMGGSSMTDASSATYGTTIGDDGWSLNFGSGAQTASPVKTTNETYSDPMTMTTPENPLTGMRQQLPRLPSTSYSSAPDTQTLLLIALGGLMLLRHK